MDLKIIKADYKDARHAADLISLLDHYASDPIGGGTPLSEGTKANLCATLSKTPNAFSFIAYLEETPVGLANCFYGFSTFQCKPLINIHDFVVMNGYRGKNISQLLLEKVENEAIETGCCKVTLEVLEGNEAACGAYRKYGFSGYELDSIHGNALFWEKVVEDAQT